MTRGFLISVAPGDGLPIYRQIVNQVKYLIAADRLTPGEELPPIRTLAEQLVVNPNTVVKAYRELESEGLVYKRRGAGTYVNRPPYADYYGALKIQAERARPVPVER